MIVVGASGQLGHSFREALGDRATYLTRHNLDLTDIAAIRREIPGGRTIINCAAYTNVDGAESDPDTARAVNAVAVGALAQACAAKGSRFVTFSTDYVFDGTKVGGYVESDPTGPLGVYGASKLEGERLALDAYPDTLVVRTSWLFSETPPNFVATMLRLMVLGEVTVVNDQVGKPTATDDLAGATLQAIEAGVSGILHLASPGPLSWYGFACEIAQVAGLDPDRVRPCTTAQFPRPAPRPTNSVLDSERAKSLGLDPLPDRHTALERAVNELQSHGP